MTAIVTRTTQDGRTLIVSLKGSLIVASVNGETVATVAKITPTTQAPAYRVRGLDAEKYPDVLLGLNVIPLTHKEAVQIQQARVNAPRLPRTRPRGLVPRAGERCRDCYGSGCVACDHLGKLE